MQGFKSIWKWVADVLRKPLWWMGGLFFPKQLSIWILKNSCLDFWRAEFSVWSPPHNSNIYANGVLANIKDNTLKNSVTLAGGLVDWYLLRVAKHAKWFQRNLYQPWDQWIFTCRWSFKNHNLLDLRNKEDDSQKLVSHNLHKNIEIFFFAAKMMLFLSFVFI